jgi:hypothetical protein
MIYTVLWRPLAEQQLAQLWNNAADRKTVTSAADTIDSVLRRDPHSKGESRSGANRVLFVPPLLVLFEVLEQDRTVYVKAVGRLRHHP